MGHGHYVRRNPGKGATKKSIYSVVLFYLFIYDLVCKFIFLYIISDSIRYLDY
jgi:hypothetical protein